MKFLDKFRDYMLGAELNDDDDEYEFIDVEEEPPIRSKSRERNVSDFSSVSRRKSDTESNLLSMPSNHGSFNNNSKVVICKPTSVNDAPSVCDYLLQNTICIITLEKVEHVHAQRIADFLAGASYTIKGEIERVSDDIFIIAPQGVKVSSELREQIKSGTSSILPWITSAFK